MSFVAVAIGGNAVVGAGASIYAGSQASKGAKQAASAQLSGLDQAVNTTAAGKADALAYLDPYRQYGLNAGASLQSAMYSPQQQQQQQTAQRIQLQGEIDRLEASKPKSIDAVTVSPGKKYQTRKQTSYYQQVQAIDKQIAQAKSQLSTFDKQVAANPISASGPKIQESPWYQFQADLLGRDMDRFNAARGLTGSGFEAEQRRVGLLQLGATETENQYNRMAHLYDVGANASNVGAGIITGASQNIANAEVGAGNAIAQGYQGVAGANANTATGVANSVTGAVGTGLNFMQFQNLINANKPVTTQPMQYDA